MSGRERLSSETVSGATPQSNGKGVHVITRAETRPLSHTHTHTRTHKHIHTAVLAFRPNALGKLSFVHSVMADYLIVRIFLIVLPFIFTV